MGHVAALVALFSAFTMTLSWATSVNISGNFVTGWISNIDYSYALPMAATAELSTLLNLEFIGDI